MASRLSNLVRWVLVAPVSLAAGYLVAGVVALVGGGETWTSNGLLALAYVAAFVAGLAYLLAALRTSLALAPSHGKIVATVLGIAILGDLAFVHLVLRGGVLPAETVAWMEEGEMRVILSLLRADDFRSLQHGGAAKTVGAAVGLLGAGWAMFRPKPGS